MTELLAWIIVVGLATAIAGIYMLSGQIEKHMRETTQMMIHGHDMIRAQLKRLADPSVEAPEPTVGVILERRCAHRRALLTPRSEKPGKAEQRRSPGRRFDDFPPTGQVGFMHL